MITAPWTQEQIQYLNRYQEVGAMHPFTCAKDEDTVLIATGKGWICPNCDYTQNWAHQFMFDVGKANTKPNYR